MGGDDMPATALLVAGTGLVIWLVAVLVRGTR